ncbi:MAG: hypothetical protein FWD49_05510 [Firmicutes bacterium]|nr:hypothetical protein [Bacillota bacterium]
MKKLTTAVTLLLLASLLFACGLFGNGNNGEKQPNDIIKPLSALDNYANRTPSAITYVDTDAVENDIRELGDKRKSVEEDNMVGNTSEERLQNMIFNTDKYGEDEASTFTRIFVYAEPQKMIERFGFAGVGATRRTDLIKYIARNDSAVPAYNLERGLGSLIRDIEDIDELQKDADEHKDGENGKIDKAGAGYLNGKTFYEGIQLKRRKIFAEIYHIFGDNHGNEMARLAIEAIAYAQDIVQNRMVPMFNTSSHPDRALHGTIEGNRRGMDEFFKKVLFDYDALVYILSYNDTVGINTPQNNSIAMVPQRPRDLMELYGYHYQAERNEFNAFSDNEYRRFLYLGRQDYFTAEHASPTATGSAGEKSAHATREYTRLQRTQYEKAGRYTSAFLRIYYGKQLDFQELQETNELTVYGIGRSGLRGGSTDDSYASQMKRAYGNASTDRLGANLAISDVNYEYSGLSNFQNPVFYNTASANYMALSPEVRRLIENNDYEQYSDQLKNNILYVERAVQQLNSQHYMLNHSKVSNTQRTQAVEFQVFNFGADYIRGIQSYKKTNVILGQEIIRIDSRIGREGIISKADFDILKAQKEDDQGRNGVFMNQMNETYTDGSTPKSVSQTINWTQIRDEVKKAIDGRFEREGRSFTGYASFHNAEFQGNKVSEVQNYGVAKKIFEDMLISRKWVHSSAPEFADYKNLPESERVEGRRGWSREYDLDHNISLFLSRYERILTHANNQVKVEYMTLADNNYRQYATDTAQPASFTFSPTNFSANFYNLSITLENDITPVYAFTANDANGRIRTSSEIKVVANANNAIPTKAGYLTKAIDSETVSTGDPLTKLYIYQGGGSDTRWMRGSARPFEGTAVYTQKDNYYLVFVFCAWFIDIDFKYIAREEDTYRYDMRLYPAFYVYRSNAVPTHGENAQGTNFPRKG